MNFVCSSKEQLDRVEAASEKITPEAWEALFQARGWATEWLSGEETIPNLITKDFIRKVDKILGITID